MQTRPQNLCDFLKTDARQNSFVNLVFVPGRRFISSGDFLQDAAKKFYAPPKSQIFKAGCAYVVCDTLLFAYAGFTIGLVFTSMPRTDAVIGGLCGLGVGVFSTLKHRSNLWRAARDEIEFVVSKQINQKTGVPNDKARPLDPKIISYLKKELGLN